MASDISSGCTDVIDEKEEGELSHDDLSSSEEGHVNYGNNSKSIEQCLDCSSTQHCASWCTAAARSNRSKTLDKKEVRLVPQDAVQGKENHHLVKGTGHPEAKNTNSTLLEKNDDLIPISSDSDMEIVGLAESTHRAKSSTVKKKKKKRRPRFTSNQVEEAAPQEVLENVTMTKRSSITTKENRLLKTHHRDKSPSHKTSSSPRRHRSPRKIRSLPKKQKSPAVDTRSTATKKSQRKLKSPGRSRDKVLVNPLHKKFRKQLSPAKLPSSPTRDVRVTRLLKKVRQLEMVGTLEIDKASKKFKEHGSSLKEKLINILKTTPEKVENTTTTTKEDSSEKKSENGEEEDDLTILRQKALETKQSKTNNTQETLNTEPDIKGSSNNEDDDEDLKLRLIALRSAVYKKHRNRVQRREKSPNKKKNPLPRSESPFSESFINNIPVVEIDGDSPAFSPQTSPRTSSAMKDCMSLEDMELDSDLERDHDLDEAPYSPTDEVNSELILEAEQLGIDATDVSLININSRPPNKFSSPIVNTSIEVTSPMRNIYCSSIYPLTPLNSDYRYPNSQNTLSCDLSLRDPLSRNVNIERPYSPSDIPIFDPDLTESLLPQNETLNRSSIETLQFVVNNNLHSIAPPSVNQVEMENANFSMPSNLNSIPHSTLSSLNPDTLISTDDFPETDIDGSPLVPMERDTSTHYHIPEHLSYQMLQPSYQPLYLRNGPYCENQIPFPINNPLVPPGVLRVNKQLQQELKKLPASVRMTEEETESVFQSSSMQPMNAESFNSRRLLKPTPIAKKQIENPVLFDQFREDCEPEINEKDKNQRTKENISVNTHKEVSISRKKRKRLARKNRRSAKKCSIETEEMKNRPNEKESNENSVDRANDSAKHLRTLETETPRSEKVPLKKVEIVNEVKSNKKRKSSAANLDENIESISKPQKNPRVITSPSETRQSTENEKAKDENPPLSKSNIKDNAPSTDVQDPKANDGSRRRSIDEDEEALRAILLASIAKRTKVSETSAASKPSAEISETATASNVTSKMAASNIQTRQTDSLRTAPKKSTEIVPKKSTEIAPKKSTENAPKKPVNLNSTAVASGTKVPINNSETVNSILGKRKSNSSLLAGSPRKGVRRTVIPASTKVVNNAKRYQNSLMQKRLNLQKSNMTFDVKRVIANRSLRVLNHNQNTRSNSPNVLRPNEGERFIISLNSDSETDSESERRNTSVAVAKKRSVEKYPPLTIPTTEFERSVDQFLRDVRQKQESTASIKQPTNLKLAKKQPPPEIPAKSRKSTTLPATPLAVRHLSASQQEEYHRLKQQILEREKLKLQRTNVSKQTSDTNTVTPPGPVSPIGPTSSSNKKTVSTVITNNPPKPLLVTKNSSVDSLPSASSSNSTLASQPKANLTIKIRNDRISPINNSTQIAPNIQNFAQAEAQEPPKQVTMPKLRILTCEQVNMKLLQIHVKQREDGRKVTVGDTDLLRKSNNITFEKSELSNQNTARREFITIQNSNFIANANSVTNKTVNSEASNIGVSKSKACDRTYDSQASTVVLSGNETSSINESRVSKTIDSEASTIILSQNNTTVTSDNNATVSSTSTTKNISNTPVDFGKRKQISTETPESGSIPPAATSTVLKAPNVRKETNVSKITTVAKDSTVTKDSTVSKLPTDPKPKIVSKRPTDREASLSLSKPIEAAREKEPIIPSGSKPEDAGKEKTVAQKISKSTDKEKCSEVWDGIKNDVLAQVEEILKLGEEEKKRKLVETEKKLVAKRYVVLDDLAEVSGSLRQWELEKDLQANLVAEVKKLREQLRVTEEKLQEQKDRVASMGLKVSIVHEKMNFGRKECFRLSKFCTGLGNRIIGQTYKVPDAGVQLVNKRLKEVAHHTSQLCKKKNEKKRRLSESEKSDNKESEVFSNEQEKSIRSIEKQDSFEFGASCERETYSESQSSSGTVADQPEKDFCNEDSSQRESEAVEILSFSGRFTSPGSIGQKENEKEDLTNSCETDANNDSSSMKKNSESLDTCHARNDTQNQSSKADNQLNKQPARPYVSILTHMRTPRSSRPDGILCPYQLMGSCHDGECHFVHHSSSH